MYCYPQQPLVYASSQEPLYMAPAEPPVSVYGSVRSELSLYGTLPRGFPRGLVQPPAQFAPGNTLHYGTLTKQQLAARPSLRDMGIDLHREDADGSFEDGSESVEASVNGSEAGETRVNKAMSRAETLARITRGVTFQALNNDNSNSNNSNSHYMVRCPAWI